MVEVQAAPVATAGALGRDLDERSDASMAALAAAPPSADAVLRSTYAEPKRLSPTARIDLLHALAKQAAWVEARQLELLAVIDAADPSPDRWATEEIAAVLRIAPSTATVRVALARRLAGPLLATRQALLAGQITARHAAVLAEAVRPLDDATGTAVQDRVLSKGADDTVAEFARRVRRAVLILDPAGQEQRHCAAVDQRRVVITPDDDGMAQLWALLPAVGAATVGAALNALAAESRKGRDGEARTADQRRADALVTMADAVLADPKRERHQGQAPAIQVTVAASTLIGQDDQPGELAGYGPISATTARRLATDENAKWRTLLTDDAGQLIEVGRRSYRPRQVLRDFIVARDRSCTFPGCAQPAVRCDLDHVRSYRRGGATDPANLQALCRRHHRAKHRTEWTPSRDGDGSTTWTSPTGHAYRTKPPPMPLDRLDDS
jgi:Domain of unknown function (DUF222)/HNH endonuclease